MNTGYDPFDAEEETTATTETTAAPDVATLVAEGSGDGKVACPACGKRVTMTKSAPFRPRQHKHATTGETCLGEVTGEPAAEGSGTDVAPTTAAPAAAGADKEAQMLPIVIASYVKTRDEIKELSASITKKVAELSEKQLKKEAWLQGYLNRSGQESAKTAFGTAFIKSGDSATVADREAFLGFMVGTALDDAIAHTGAKLPEAARAAFLAGLVQSGAWNFLTNAISKTEVKQSITAESPHAPPGVNYTMFQKVQVNRPK